VFQDQSQKICHRNMTSECDLNLDLRVCWGGCRFHSADPKEAEIFAEFFLERSRDMYFPQTLPKSDRYH